VTERAPDESCNQVATLKTENDELRARVQLLETTLKEHKAGQPGSGIYILQPPSMDRDAAGDPREPVSVQSDIQYTASWLENKANHVVRSGAAHRHSPSGLNTRVDSRPKDSQPVSTPYDGPWIVHQQPPFYRSPIPDIWTRKMGSTEEGQGHNSPANSSAHQWNLADVVPTQAGACVVSSDTSARTTHLTTSANMAANQAKKPSLRDDCDDMRGSRPPPWSPNEVPATQAWDLIRSHPLVKQGLVDIGDVCERLKGRGKHNGYGSVLEESVIWQAVEESRRCD
jgi:hypothetical protein